MTLAVNKETAHRDAQQLKKGEYVTPPVHEANEKTLTVATKWTPPMERHKSIMRMTATGRILNATDVTKLVISRKHVGLGHLHVTIRAGKAADDKQ